MSITKLRRIVHTLAATATLGVIGGWLLTLDAVRGALATSTVALLATLLLAIPLAVHVAFLVLQALPGGRRVVPIPLTRSPDAWVLIFVITLLGPKAQLAEWAIAPWSAGERGVSVSLVTAVLGLAARVYQLNRGAAIGAT